MAKKKKTYKPEEVGMLLEDINGKVSVIAEQHLTTDKKINGLDKKVDTLTKRIDGVAENVEVIKLDIEFIKNELKSKVNRNEFAALERRVSLLENRR